MLQSELQKLHLQIKGSGKCDSALVLIKDGFALTRPEGQAWGTMMSTDPLKVC